MEQQQQQQHPQSTQQGDDQQSSRWTAPLLFHMMAEIPTSVASSTANPQSLTHEVNILEYCKLLYRGFVFRFPDKYNELGIKALLKDLQKASLCSHPEARISCASTKRFTMTKDGGQPFEHKKWNLRCMHYNRVKHWQQKLKVASKEAAAPASTNDFVEPSPLQDHHDTTNNQKGGSKQGKRGPGRPKGPCNPFSISKHSKKCPFSVEICRDGESGNYYMKGGLGCAFHQYHVHADPSAVKETTTTTATRKKRTTTTRKRSATKGPSQDDMKSSPPLEEHLDEEEEDVEDDADDDIDPSDEPAACIMDDDDDDDDVSLRAALEQDHVLHERADAYQHPYQQHLPLMVKEFMEDLAPLANQLFSTIDHPSLSVSERQRFMNRAHAAHQQLLQHYSNLVSEANSVAYVRDEQARLLHNIFTTATSRSTAKRRRTTRNY